MPEGDDHVSVRVEQEHGDIDHGHLVLVIVALHVTEAEETADEKLTFSTTALTLDLARTTESIERTVRQQVQSLHRRGIVVGLSGGVDSSVVTCLSVRALGADRVQVLLMPERDSSSDSLRLGRLLTNHLGVPTLVEDLTQVLDAASCYARQIEAIRSIFPEYGDGYRCKIALPSILGGERLNVSLHNLYGPTEITVDAIYWIFGDELYGLENVPLGRACENKSVIFVDTDGRPVIGTPVRWA